MHMMAAQLGCFVAPILDAIATSYALSLYFGGGEHGSMVHLNSAELVPSVMWLAATITRLVTLVTAVTCGLRFAGEVFGGTGKYRTNPLRVSSHGHSNSRLRTSAAACDEWHTPFDDVAPLLMTWHPFR